MTKLYEVEINKCFDAYVFYKDDPDLPIKDALSINLTPDEKIIKILAKDGMLYIIPTASIQGITCNNIHNRWENIDG